MAACVRADLGGVDAGADGDDRLVRRRELPRLVGRERARIGQPLVGRPNPLEIPDVLRRADDGGDRAVALGRRPRSTSFDAIGCGGDELEVALDGVGRRQLAVGAHPEAEVRLGRENRRENLLRRRGRDADRGQNRRDRERSSTSFLDIGPWHVTGS